MNWTWLCISTASFFINLNGALIGNFKASRGLILGDPLSPCLFILIMKGFTQLLKGKISSSHFNFHPKCHHLNRSSLVFADDLFILSKTDTTSIMLIKEVLEEFKGLSGLLPNSQKCEVYTSGISSSVKSVLGDILGMLIGSLPVRYLGVSVIAGKFSLLIVEPCWIGLLEEFKISQCPNSHVRVAH